jgi:hypothetical protein
MGATADIRTRLKAILLTKTAMAALGSTIMAGGIAFAAFQAAEREGEPPPPAEPGTEQVLGPGLPDKPPDTPEPQLVYRSPLPPPESTDLWEALARFRKELAEPEPEPESACLEPAYRPPTGAPGLPGPSTDAG